MDEQRLTRIERNLDRLLEQSLPREEFERHFTRLESRVGKALDRLGAAEGQLKAIVALEKRVDEHEGRLDEIEDVTIPQKHHQRRRTFLWPTLATIGATIVNGGFAVFTFFASRGHGGY